MVMVITATVNKSDYDNMLRTYWLKEDIDADLEVDGVKYKKGENTGLFGILSPMRTDYEGNLSIIKHIIEKLK